MERRELSIKDIFKRTDCIGLATYGAYEMCYQQSTCELHRWPELYLFFKNHDLNFVHNNFHQCVGISQSTYSTKPAPDFKELVMLLFQCFQSSQKIVLVGFENGRLKDLELRGSAWWLDEPFEALRNRKLFDLRNYLGLKHGGYGKDSIRIWSDRFPQPMNYEI